MGANTKFCHIVNFVFAPIQLIQNLQYEREKEREREREREGEREGERENHLYKSTPYSREKNS